MINFQELEKVAEFKNGELNWLEGRDINAVYVILVGDEFYIGSSHYTYLRIGQHIEELKNKKHHSHKLQDKFNKEQEFEVFILERGIAKTQLVIKEKQYIQKFNPSLNVMHIDRGKGRSRFPNRIKEILAQRGMTSLELANEIGISRVSLSNIINNKQEASANTLKTISDSLGVEFWELFMSKDDIIKGVVEENQNTITCPTCGTKIEFKKKEE